MKVSIITVTFNSAQFLEQCIQSIIAQDYQDIEYIVIDGGSTDNTLDILLKYNFFITKWLSEKDEGMYHAINKGIQLSSGDVIGTLHSDDLYASNDVVSKIVASFKLNNVKAIYGDIEYISRNDTNKVVRQWKGKSFNRFNFNFGWMPAHPSFYIFKSVLQLGGDYDSFFSSSADYELMIRYLYNYNISTCYLPLLMVKMRIGGISNKNIQNRIRANRFDYLAMKKNYIYFPWLVAILKPLRKILQFKYAIFSPKYS